ncbi:MAG: energy-coupling factor transporter transmembrane component T family protein [Candidatus Nanopelagicaceae bacterium]
MRLDNFQISIGALAAIALIVKTFKSDGPWAGSFNFALKLALAIIAFRVFIGIVIGVPVPGTNLFTLPIIPLPDWMAGIRLGGPVTWERVSSTILESFDIAIIILLFGAATSLTNPRALIRSFPPIFYELGMVLIISSSLTPQFVGNLKRIKNAQQIRGVSGNRFLAWRQIAMPLLEDSLARSLDLAAAMDARGYGISRSRSKYRPQKFQLMDLAVVAISILIMVVSL